MFEFWFFVLALILFGATVIIGIWIWRQREVRSVPEIRHPSEKVSEPSPSDTPIPPPRDAVSIRELTRTSEKPITLPEADDYEDEEKD